MKVENITKYIINTKDLTNLLGIKGKISFIYFNQTEKELTIETEDGG